MLTRDRIDVFWGTRHVLPRNAKRVALVATLYDFWYERFPQQMPLANRTLNHAVMRDLMRDGDVLTAISDAVADDARSLYPKSAEKVRTVLLGLNPSGYSPAGEAAVMAVRDRLGVNGPFVLALDVHNPRKNFSAVLDAVALMPRGGVEIVAGGTSRAAARDQSIEHHAEQLGLSDRVRFVGDVSHADLLALYSGCGVFVYPSVYEGFGMPVLEAMACGAPVICSDTSSLPQVVGEAALMVDPTSAEQLSAALVSVLGEPLEAQRLRDLGLIRAREFTWARTAAGMRAAFEAAIAAHQS
jgi:glycosyltransferase involved in cell wall biosynthesis